MRYLIYFIATLYSIYGFYPSLTIKEIGQTNQVIPKGIINFNASVLPILKFNPRPNDVYLCCRGTKQKQGMIAGKFNFSDTNITHIGIGFTTKEGFKIFHVSDRKKAGRYFCREGVSDFISEKGTRYFSAWKMEADSEMLNAIKLACLDEKNNKIVFDTHFSSKNGDTLYCSEFCRNILMNLGFDCVFPTKITALPGDFYKMYFGSDSLRYVPVDFFLSCGHLKKYFESFIM